MHCKGFSAGLLNPGSYHGRAVFRMHWFQLEFPLLKYKVDKFKIIHF